MRAIRKNMMKKTEKKITNVINEEESRVAPDVGKTLQKCVHSINTI